MHSISFRVSFSKFQDFCWPLYISGVFLTRLGHETGWLVAWRGFYPTMCPPRPSEGELYWWLNLSHDVRKPVFGVSTKSDTNLAMQPQVMR